MVFWFVFDEMVAIHHGVVDKPQTGFFYLSLACFISAQEVRRNVAAALFDLFSPQYYEQLSNLVRNLLGKL